jgi:hypothetical protein
MKQYTKIYMDYFGYDTSDFICCEVCGNQGVDTHHIEARSMGGTKKKDEIFNLMCLCRHCHVKYGDKKQYKDFLKNTHLEFMSKMGGNNGTK